MDAYKREFRPRTEDGSFRYNLHRSKIGYYSHALLNTRRAESYGVLRELILHGSSTSLQRIIGLGAYHLYIPDRMRPQHAHIAGPESSVCIVVYGDYRVYECVYRSVVCTITFGHLVFRQLHAFLPNSPFPPPRSSRGRGFMFHPTHLLGEITRDSTQASSRVPYAFDPRPVLDVFVIPLAYHAHEIDWLMRSTGSDEHS
jgi:hypothetical protein